MMDIDYVTNPPAYGSDDDTAPRPGSVLLEHYAYLADRHNATTAICDLRGPKLKGSLQVTFFTVQRPKVSYYCVHATDLPPTKFAIEPEILATEGRLALIRVVIGSRAAVGKPHKKEYFVYDAGAKEGKPSLKQLPNPSPYILHERSVAIVRNCGRRRLRQKSSKEDHECSHCNYVIAALRRDFGSSGPYDLCLYHSETDTWSTRQVLAQQVASYPLISMSKAIVIGGEEGTIGFVDLGRGIVFCNVLTVTNCPIVLRCLEMPKSIMSKAAVRKGAARSTRDISVVDGFIKFIELHNRYVLVSAIDGNCKYDSNGWKATGWSIEIAGFLSMKSGWDWNKDYELDSLQISCSWRPNLQFSSSSYQRPLQNLYIGLPKLSLQDDGIVCFLAKIDYRDTDRAWVLALDTSNRVIHQVDEFCAERTRGLGIAYITSRISKYLKVAPVYGRHVVFVNSATKPKPKRQKRQESCSKHETEVVEVSTGTEFSENMVLE